MNKKEMLQSIINHYTGGNKAAFAKMIGVNPQQISHWIRRNTFDNELLFKKCPGISSSWLLTGEGEMLVAPPAQTTTASSKNLSAKDEIIAAKDEVISALRQSITDKERLILTLLADRTDQQQ